MNTETEWRTITDFPGYSASDTGFVRNDRTGRILGRHVYGRFLMVTLRKMNMTEVVCIHDLVAATFSDIVGPRPENEVVEGTDIDQQPFTIVRPYWLTYKNGNFNFPEAHNLVWAPRGSCSAQVNPVSKKAVRLSLSDAKLLRLCGVPGFPDYCASDDGRIWKMNGSDYRLIVGFRQPLRDGELADWTYLQPSKLDGVGLKRVAVYYHEVVALAWLGPTPPGYHVWFRDLATWNCEVSNLCWVDSRIYRHVRKLGLDGEWGASWKYDATLRRWDWGS